MLDFSRMTNARPSPPAYMCCHPVCYPDIHCHTMSDSCHHPISDSCDPTPILHMIQIVSHHSHPIAESCHSLASYVG